MIITCIYLYYYLKVFTVIKIKVLDPFFQGTAGQLYAKPSLLTIESLSPYLNKCNYIEQRDLRI